MITAITGHREIPNAEQLKASLADAYARLHSTTVIQGMASGADLISAGVAYQQGIPFIAARPWAGHSPRVADKLMYEWALRNAQEIVNVQPAQGYPGVWVYQARNVYMIDRADHLLAIWDGRENGGTYNAVMYAQSRGKEVYVLSPSDKSSEMRKL